MKRIMRTSVALLAAFVMAFTGAFVFNGIYTPVYADVGSVADDEDVEYDKDGGVLNSLGIDTSKMPEAYDPNSTDNPYGSDVTTLNEVREFDLFETWTQKSFLCGHNAALDGSYDTLMDSKIESTVPFLSVSSFVACAECDVKGNGRSSALAVVYTNYNSAEYDPDNPSQNNIYLTIYDPISGDYTDPVKISSFIEDRITDAFLVQSQLQVTCGDYDNDSVDEVAVYVTADSDNGRPKVSVFDLINGKDSQNPFLKSAWQLSWNYVLPLPPSSSEVIGYWQHGEMLDVYTYFSNFYSDIDLTSGDANNDGPCDLVVSYGASSTNVEGENPSYDQVTRSFPSQSVLLYGSDKGQMLRESQSISYDSNKLIRVSFAFGDLDDDGNEEMLLGGQLVDEQSVNESRVLGKYVYDKSSKKMVPEVVQNMDVVDGSMKDGHFSTNNGWDEHYFSLPVMKANIAVGKFYGETSANRIYLDSVLYSYDNIFSIVDELEDTNTQRNSMGEDIPKGSQAMVGIKSDGSEWGYYEYGAEAANYTGGAYDYALVNRVSKPKPHAGAAKIEAVATKLIVEGEEIDKAEMKGKHQSLFYENAKKGSPFVMSSPDTDVDGIVAEYTGIHNIKYEKPRVDAVLISAPYFKDVAAYDDGNMLGNCSTGYGHSDGTDNGYEHSVSFEVGLHVDIEDGGFFSDGDVGLCLSSSWGENTTQEYTISYEAQAGEDSVVLYSVPHEHFEYIVHGVMVDDDGNIEPYTERMTITYPHQPVHQVLTVEDYMEVQSEYPKILPNVKEYYKSKPGDPSTYPKDDEDMPEAASNNLKSDDSEDHVPMKCAAKEFEGIGYGGGSITQSFTTTHTVSESGDNVMVGGFTDFDVGGGGGVPGVYSIKVGLHTAISGEQGSTASTSKTDEYSCTVANMPRSAKDYGYDFSWKLFEYNVQYTVDKGEEDKVDQASYYFPIVTYIVDDVMTPPALPEKIDQDFDNTTDTQTALTWTYNTGNPQEFLIYKYLDFPQGGGNLLAGTVAGSDYRIKKDENGNTLKDKDGNVIHEYTFIDSNLTPDTKYQYRVKVKRGQFPQESIFSPIIEARTDVSQKPDVTLTSDNLKIYPDGVYRLSVVLADPENYEGTINYQWQKYDAKKRVWDDVSGCTSKTIAFYKCDQEDEGDYRCRVNLIRRVESHPQYISTYTNTCVVDYSKRNVQFGDISVHQGRGSSPINTGVSVSVMNESAGSVEKPTGVVQFSFVGANATFFVSTQIDEATGIAKVDSLEDGMGSLTMKDFTDGGYKVTASYQGSAIFYAAEDPEEYHYLRNINECLWLSARTSYIFGEDIMQTTNLYDYKKGSDGSITRTDLTDEITTVKFYKVNANGDKDGEALATYDLSETNGKAFLPLDTSLAKKAYVEVYTSDGNNPAGSATFKTEKMITKLKLRSKLTGVGDLLELYDDKDIVLSGDGNLKEKNIVTEHGNKSLLDLIKFKYYEENGDYLFDSDTASQHTDEFIPAEYVVKLDCPDPISTFYKLTLKPGDYTVVGNYYKVKAACSDENAGIVSMLSPDKKTEYRESGYAGGTKLIFKAVPDKGYQVKRWIINECGVDEYTLPASDTATYIVKSENTIGNGEVTITAVLTPKNNTLSYEATGQGTVEVTPQIESGSTVVADTDLTFKATPTDGWKFLEWKWINEGGKNSIAKGVTAEDGTNTKTFTMPDNSVTVYGIFMRDTIDIDLTGALNAAYINDGSNPLEENGKIVDTDSGQDVPKGAQVIISTKSGYVLADDATWNVTITTPDGTYEANVEEYIYKGQDGCKFTLPDDATACQVVAETEKGKYSIDASADDVEFEIKVDDVVMEGTSISGIDAGSDIEVKAMPVRGKVLDSWVINGETIESKDALYSTSINENLSISVNTSADTKYTLKLKTSGGGTGQYVITDKCDRTIPGTFGGSQITEDVYKGETVTLSSGDPQYTLTAVSINGKNYALDDDHYDLKDISENNDVICRFTPSTYCNIGFTNDARNAEISIMDDNGIVLDEGEGIAVPYGSTATFKVIIDNQYESNVFDGDTEIPYKEVEDYNTDKKAYTYELPNVKNNKILSVRDYGTYRIETKDDLTSYFEILNSKTSGYPNAVLVNDIDMENGELSRCAGTFDAVFDGHGHVIQNSNFDACLFGSIGAKGCVKDVIFNNAKTSTSSPGVAIIADTNYGTISGIQLVDSELHNDGESYDYCLAGIAYTNYGLIQDNRIIALKITASNIIAPISQTLGPACVNTNLRNNDFTGIVKNNYIEDLECSTSNTIVRPSEKAIISYPSEYPYDGDFIGNYFKQPFGTRDIHGTSVYTLTEHPNDEEQAIAEAETAEFTRKLAYTMNGEREENIWGVSGNEDVAFTQIANGGEDCKAPVKAVFNTAGQSVSLYLYPNKYNLPGRETFGDNTPLAWECGGHAYSPDCNAVSITKDSVFTGINEMTGYVASVEVENAGIQYFKDLGEALETAKAHSEGTTQNIKILGECVMEEIAFTIDRDTVMTLENDSKLTMKKSASIINKGGIVCAAGSTMHKYGTIQNNGSIEVLGTFYNYGSKLTNKGDIINQENIICKPHRAGKWAMADKPNDDGTWTKSATCEVCNQSIHENIDPNPETSSINSIQLLSKPDKDVYEVGEAFESDGMIVKALLTDGDEAVITDYTMTFDDKELKNGDILDTEGMFNVTVSYGQFTCGFDLDVLNTADLLTITDGGGNEITEIELKVNDSQELDAQLKHALAQSYGFLFETSDPDVVSIDNNTLEFSHNVFAMKPGTATITVTVVDENENPIEGIQPKTVEITVVDHVTDIEIIGGNKELDVGDTYQLQAKVIPEDTTDAITWSTSDESVVTVDQDGFITAVGGGKAAITASSPNGISSSITVTVYEKAGTLTLNADVLDIATERFAVLAARVEPATCNGTMTWSIDDSSVAGFYVRDEKSGEMVVSKEAKTDLSADGSEYSDSYVIVVGVANGEAIVNASTEGADGTLLEQECQVVVSDQDEYVSITQNGAIMSGKTLNLNIDGRIIQLGAESSIEDDVLTWSVIDDGLTPVIKVNSTGKVTLLHTGIAGIKVTSEITGATDVCAIKVRRNATGIVLSDEAIRLAAGETQVLIGTLEPEDADSGIIWTSSDDSVATVASDGTVTAVADGTCTITAKPDNEGASSDSCEVTVYEPFLTLELSQDLYTFNGKMHYPSVTVKAGRTILGENLTKSNDKVILAYDGGRKLPGMYTVTAVANDKSYGFGTASYKIQVKPTKIKKLKKGKKSFTVKWKKIGKKYITGYQVKYSLHEDMSKAKIKTINKYKTKSKKIKKLKANKKYYVKVRTFVKRGGVKYYSDWSDIKTVTTKK